MKGSGPAKKKMKRKLKLKYGRSLRGGMSDWGLKLRGRDNCEWKCENVKVSSGKKLSRLCNI